MKPASEAGSHGTSLRRRCIAHIHTADPYDGAGRAAKYKTLATLSKKYAPRSTAMLHSMLYGAQSTDYMCCLGMTIATSIMYLTPTLRLFKI